MKNLVRCGIAALMMFGACQAMARAGSCYEFVRLQDDFYLTQDGRMLVVTSFCRNFGARYDAGCMDDQKNKMFLWTMGEICRVDRIVTKIFGPWERDVILTGSDNFYGDSANRAYIRTTGCNKSVSGEKAKASTSTGTGGKVTFPDGSTCRIEGVYR